MREIKDVFVNWISLVTKNETPAVEQAENRFALFKTKKRTDIDSLNKIQVNLQKRKLEKIQENINVLL